VRFFGAQATGCSPISTAVKNGTDEIVPQRPNTIARSLAIGNPADGLMLRVRSVHLVDGLKTCRTSKSFRRSRNWRRRKHLYRDRGRVTTLSRRGFTRMPHQADELTVSCITGNGLKTTDCLQGIFEEHKAIRPRWRTLKPLSRNTTQ